MLITMFVGFWNYPVYKIRKLGYKITKSPPFLSPFSVNNNGDRRFAETHFSNLPKPYPLSLFPCHHFTFICNYIFVGQSFRSNRQAHSVRFRRPKARDHRPLRSNTSQSLNQFQPHWSGLSSSRRHRCLLRWVRGQHRWRVAREAPLKSIGSEFQFQLNLQMPRYSGESRNLLRDFRSRRR